MKAGIFSQGLLLFAIPAGSNIKKEPVRSEEIVSVIGLPQKVYAAFNPDTSFIPALSDSSAQATEVKTPEVQMPSFQMNPKAESYVKSYVKKNTSSLLEVKGRSKTFFTLMDTVFTKYQLPLELKYLAVIESRLKLKARSHAGAVGPWQLMPATARLLGLKITKKTDERTQSYKSTVAAAKYLKWLHREYGDWLLVIAAYNAGPGNVNAAIRKAGSRDFWKLQSFLPAETRGHVKRFIATHYFFEGVGSETTLTKAELAAYKKSMEAYLASRRDSAAKAPKASEVSVAALDR